MGKITLDQEALGLASTLGKITGARVLDCFKDEQTIFFIVARGDMGRALGKGGSNIKRLERELSRKIKLVEFNDSVTKFVANFIAPIKVEEIEQKEDVIEVRDSSKKTKSLLIGRQGRNLNMLKRAVSRFFPVDVKVI